MMSASLSSFNPRFGWNNHDDRPKPEDYLFKLKAEDFKNQDQLILKKSVLKNMAKSLVRKEGDFSSPGFFYIPNLADFTGSLSKIRRFQNQLVKELFKLTHRDLGRKERYCSVKQEKVRGLQSHFDTLGVEQLHWDGHPNTFISLLHGERENIEGGESILGDFLQFEKDNKLNCPSYYAPANMAKFSALTEEEHQLTKKQHQSFMKNYVITLPFEDKTYPLLFVNNNRQLGILHNGNKVRVLDPDKPVERALFHSKPEAGVMGAIIQKVAELIDFK